MLFNFKHCSKYFNDAYFWGVFVEVLFLAQKNSMIVYVFKLSLLLEFAFQVVFKWFPFYNKNTFLYFTKFVLIHLKKIFIPFTKSFGRFLPLFRRVWYFYVIRCKFVDNSLGYFGYGSADDRHTHFECQTQGWVNVTTCHVSYSYSQ